MGEYNLKSVTVSGLEERERVRVERRLPLPGRLRDESAALALKDDKFFIVGWISRGVVRYIQSVYFGFGRFGFGWTAQATRELGHVVATRYPKIFRE